MITLLEKWFIKNKENIKSPAVRHAYGILCGVLGIIINILLFAFKLFAGTISHSIAITADAFNNLSDAGSSIITLIGFKLAASKPDEDHPFGHGRMEYISGLLVSLMILLMGYELTKSSFMKIFHPVDLDFSPVIIIILILSIAAKCYMAFYNYRIGKKINSAAMKATATDSLSDTVSTFVVLIATLVSFYTPYQIDGICGTLVGIFILIAGIKAAKETIDPLLGTAPDPEYVKQIEDIVLSHEPVIGIHDLIVHNYGPGRTLISLHAEVPSDGDILKMHDTIDLIEHHLQHDLMCSAVIHMDPVCVNDPFTRELKQIALDVLASIDETLSLHDFRTVIGPTHTNLIFDVVTPYRYRYTDEQLRKIISEELKKKNPNYFAVIEVDKKYA